MDRLALVVQGIAVLLTLAGMAYGVIALWGARDFERSGRGVDADAVGAVGVSVLKPVKGAEPRMYAGFLSHCRQTYAGRYELVFGVSSLQDAAVPEIARLRVENPGVAIRVVECPLRLGTNGKVSNLAQMLPHARYEHVVVNDSDIRVSARYLERVMAGFATTLAETQIHAGNDKQKGGAEGKGVGLVTVPYRGRAERGLWSRLEALGISTDFMAGVLTGGSGLGWGRRWRRPGRRFRPSAASKRWWTSSPTTTRWGRG
jgi:ceramide glucosyltransferase